jgi:hypothetical protein
LRTSFGNQFRNLCPKCRCVSNHKTELRGAVDFQLLRNPPDSLPLHQASYLLVDLTEWVNASAR